MVYDDRHCMLRAIENARKCENEHSDRASPRVGAVVVDQDGELIGEAFRGELAPGEHAEFTLLEKKLTDATLAGATLFTTLEPCTTRNPPKIPCADRVVERRIAKVVIGTLDPNPMIRGNGELRLRSAGVAIGRFDADLMPIIEELNRHFIRQHGEVDIPAASLGQSIDQPPVGVRPDEKRWIDCAYCPGGGTVLKSADPTHTEYQSCGVCGGRGQIFTDLWSQPVCRRCSGSGLLLSEQVMRWRRVRHRTTYYQPCDVCLGTGRMPFLEDS